MKLLSLALILASTAWASVLPEVLDQYSPDQVVWSTDDRAAVLTTPLDDDPKDKPTIYEVLKKTPSFVLFISLHLLSHQTSRFSLVLKAVDFVDEIAVALKKADNEYEHSILLIHS